MFREGDTFKGFTPIELLSEHSVKTTLLQIQYLNWSELLIIIYLIIIN